MRLRMLCPLSFADAGVLRPLDAGREYEIPDSIAESWIISGFAERAVKRGRPPNKPSPQRGEGGERGEPDEGAPAPLFDNDSPGG